jgi:hypothetical protein
VLGDKLGRFPRRCSVSTSETSPSPKRHRLQLSAEKSFLTRDLGNQHHAEQEQINVAALGDARERLRNGNHACLKYYIGKLLGTFADDPWRGHYYARNVIAPRFAGVWLALYVRTARSNNHAKMVEYASEGLALARYLSGRPRLVYSNAFRLFLGASHFRFNLIKTPIWKIGVRFVRLMLTPK